MSHGRHRYLEQRTVTAAQLMHLQHFWKRLGGAGLQKALARSTTQLNQGQQRHAHFRRVDLCTVARDDARILQFPHALSGSRSG